MFGTEFPSIKGKRFSVSHCGTRSNPRSGVENRHAIQQPVDVATEVRRDQLPYFSDRGLGCFPVSNARVGQGNTEHEQEAERLGMRELPYRLECRFGKDISALVRFKNAVRAHVRKYSQIAKDRAARDVEPARQVVDVRNVARLHGGNNIEDSPQSL